MLARGIGRCNAQAKRGRQDPPGKSPGVCTVAPEPLYYKMADANVPHAAFYSIALLFRKGGGIFPQNVPASFRGRGKGGGDGTSGA